MKRVLIDVSTACFAKCKYCLHQYRGMVRPEYMSMDLFEEVIEKCLASGYHYVYPYLSGEPMLNKDYWNMIAHMSELGIESNTASKLCFKMDFKKIEKILSRLRKHVHFDVTIDAADQETQSKISIGINNDQVYHNLKRLADIASYCDIDITVITVSNKYNVKQLDLIKSRVQSCGISKWGVKPMGYYMGYKMEQRDHALICDMILPSNPRCFVINGMVKSRMSLCNSYLKPVVGVHGEVTICCHDMLYKNAKWNIRNVDKLEDIVQSSEYSFLTAQGHEMKLDICSGCN